MKIIANVDTFFPFSGEKSREEQVRLQDMFRQEAHRISTEAGAMVVGTSVSVNENGIRALCATGYVRNIEAALGGEGFRPAQYRFGA
ncbi:MAG: hypothetical protein H6868_04760 [Rhodospirillales bacterium]|nr:hypothetical protein [Rhodospirillales bacterium]